MEIKCSLTWIYLPVFTIDISLAFTPPPDDPDWAGTIYDLAASCLFKIEHVDDDAVSLGQDVRLCREESRRRHGAFVPGFPNIIRVRWTCDKLPTNKEFDESQFHLLGSVANFTPSKRWEDIRTTYR